MPNNNYNKIIGLLIISLLTVVSKLLGLLREIIIANNFGSNLELNAYLISTAVPVFISNVFIVGISSILVPKYLGTSELRDKNYADEELWFFTKKMVIFSLFLVLFILFFNPQYIKLLNVSTDGTTNNFISYVTLYSSLQLPLAVIFYCLSVKLIARNKYFLPSFLSLFGIIFSILLMLLYKELGIFSLVYGMLFGGVVEASVIFIFFYYKKARIKEKINSNFVIGNMKEQYLALIIASLLSSASSIVDQSMALLVSREGPAFLSYSSRLIGAISSVLLIPISTVATTYFSELLVQKNFNKLKLLTNKFIFFLLVPLIFIPIFFSFYSKYFIYIFFQSGEFTEYQTNIVSPIQTAYSFQVPFYVIGGVMVRLLYALNKTKYLMLVGFSNLLLNIILNYIFIKIWGLIGIAYSTSFVFLISFLLLYLIINRELLNLINKKGNLCAE